MPDQISHVLLCGALTSMPFDALCIFSSDTIFPVPFPLWLSFCPDKLVRTYGVVLSAVMLYIFTCM